jgi:NAD(P)-dependent dehydrogenase (short-subunit alcohol dehydrogenase family)
VNNESFQHKVAVVTGGSRGIGLATARAFAERGAHVVMLARGEERLRKEAAAIGERALPLTTDITDPDAVRRTFAEIDTRFGRVDVLVNNAGVARIRHLEETSDEEVRLQVDTNFLGPIWCTRAAIPLLKKAGGGDVLNVTSESILDPYPLLSLYASSKAGLATFSEAMNRELRPNDIRVSLLIVGRTDTEFSAEWTEEETARGYEVWEAEGFLKSNSAQTKMDPADVADTILYAVSRPRSQVLDVFRVRTRD